jgi:hypothetical protein
MQKLSEKKIKIIHRSGQNVSGTSAPKKSSTFFSFFTFSRAEGRGKNTSLVIKAPTLKSPSLNVPRVDLDAVKSWVALEEKIVHDYKEQKISQAKNPVLLPKIPVQQPVELNVPRASLKEVMSWVALEEKIIHDYKEQEAAPLKSPVPLPKTPAKQTLPAFENVSTKTAVSPAPRAPKLKEPLLDTGKTFSILDKFLLLVGVLAAGASVFLFVQGTLPNRDASQKLVQLQSEKEKLGRSNAELKNASEKQSAEMQWLNSQLHDMEVELNKARAEKVVFEQGLEKKYREELMRITVRYESEMAALRGTLQTQKSIVNALKAQGQAFEKILDQVGMSALSGAAAGFSQEPFSTSGTFGIQGEVTSVNERQGFIVISVGAGQGAHSGRFITISRSGIRLAVGRIDRVYPTTSTAGFSNAGMLQVVQEGDNVSFS